MIEWEHPVVDLHWDLLEKVLARIPVPTVMMDEPRRDLFLQERDHFTRVIGRAGNGRGEG